LITHKNKPTPGLLQRNIALFRQVLNGKTWTQTAEDNGITVQPLQTQVWKICRAIRSQCRDNNEKRLLGDLRDLAIRRNATLWARKLDEYEHANAR